MIVDPVVLPAFLVAVAIIVLVPGPDMAFVVASGIEGGASGAIRAAFGITTGVTVHVVVTAAGLGGLLARSPALLDLVRAAGASYLVLLSRRSLRDAATRAAAGGLSAIDVDVRRFLRRGFLVNVTNPKVAVFFAAFLPQFVAPERGSTWLQLVFLGLLLQGLGLLVDLGVAVSAGMLRRSAGRKERAAGVLQRGAAAVYLLMALAVLVDLVRDHV